MQEALAKRPRIEDKDEPVEASKRLKLDNG